MKEIVVSLLFALLTVPQVFARSTYQEENYVDDEEENVYASPSKNTYGSSSSSTYAPVETPTEYRNSFFWRITSGLNIEFGNIYKENDRYKEMADFSAAGETFSLQMGANFKRLFAIYFGSDFTMGSGSYCPYYDECRDATHYKFNFNIGTLLYPFRSVPVMRGINVGASLGFEGDFLNVQSPRYSDETDIAMDSPGFALKTEIGYAWNVSRRISIGIEFNFTFNFLIPLEEEDDLFGEDTYSEPEAYSIGILFNIMRR